ncbi:hypothetical protein FDP41_000415 [Naegleria fowleri]|uniref:RING-type domain-containing protein n=1 Tax=Naegleria fowleri TaxID=5763 RepID=A0A6A5C9V4_NAEFO|nr:uncharacterized protein FDP41_000415 [Naegleria fowleri]KAF0984516.1 hypothetical protein FDP41_000415 [Naegleria fowleri]CAG4711556.1 unnamed protein product [Naegleria fowleri]
MQAPPPALVDPPVDVMAQNQHLHKDPAPIIPAGFLLFVVVLIIVLQFLVQLWKKYHRYSFVMTSFFLMWLFPGIFCVFIGGLTQYSRMMIIWTVYSIFTIYLGYLSLRKALSPNTPKKVYVWFYTVYKLSHISVIFGTVLLGLEVFFGLYSLIVKYILMDSSFGIYLFPSPEVLIFYGLYFGVLVRDCGELCSSAINASLEADRNKFYMSHSQLEHVCGICNQELRVDTSLDFESAHSGDSETPFTRRITDDVTIPPENKRKTTQETKVLSCGHKFHEFCVYGWLIIGKKSTCPICKENVDPKQHDLLQKHPWKSDSEFYIGVLDLTRYFVVFNPIILIVIQLVVMIFFKIYQ